jgi:hypothetical protein
MFEDALRYPWNGEQKLETLLIGGLLTLLGVVFVPILFVYGYLVRVVRRVAAGETSEPPPFGEWGELFVDGIAAFVVSVVYFLVPAIVVTAGALLFLLPVTAVEAAGPSAGGGLVAIVGLLLALLGVVVAVVLTFAALYLVPAAVAAFARSGRFGAAFSPSMLRPIAGDRRYATGWLVAVAVSLVVQIVASVVAATGVGAILVPFLLFYGYVAGAYAVGVGISDIAIGAETDEEAASTGAPM